MNSNKLAMTVEEAAEYTGIGRNTMRQLIERKRQNIRESAGTP